MENQMYEVMFKSYPDVVDIEQLRQMLYIGRSLAYKIVNGKIIPAKKIGRRFIIAKADVIKYVMKQEADEPQSKDA